MNDPGILRIKATYSYDVIHVQETGWQSDVRSCIMSGLPTHLAQELIIRTVSYS